MRLANTQKKENKMTQKIYKLICKDFGHKFSFNAKNIKDAESKIREWTAYHSHSFSDYTIEETADTKWIHNEWVN